MTKEWLMTEGIRARELYEFAHLTIFGWKDSANNVYAVTLRHIPRAWLKFDRASTSKGGVMKVRVKPSVQHLNGLHTNLTFERLGKYDELHAAYEKAYLKYNARRHAEDPKRYALVDKAPKNDGWMLECYYRQERAGQTWEPDQVKFWKGPDVVVNGIEYQVKFNTAEYFNEQSIESCLKDMAQ